MMRPIGVRIKKLVFLGFILFWLPVLSANQQTANVQEALAKEGFYNGELDGKLGDETRAALRRYQIRNGLDVSGAISPETLTALKIKPTHDAVAAREVEREIVAERPRVEPKSRIGTVRVESEKPTREAPAARSPVRDYFAETEMETEPTRVQSQTLFGAQQELLRLGYYRSAPDGLPGPETETALLKFQHANRLRKTGRLDRDTLAALYNAERPIAAKPFRNPGNRPIGQVYRGVWVR